MLGDGSFDGGFDYIGNRCDDGSGRILRIPRSPNRREKSQHNINRKRSGKAARRVECDGSDGLALGIVACDVRIYGDVQRAVSVKDDISLSAANSGNGGITVFHGDGERSISVGSGHGSFGLRLKNQRNSQAEPLL